MIKLERKLRDYGTMKSSHGATLYLYEFPVGGISISCYKSNGNPNNAVLNRIYDKLNEELGEDKFYFCTDELIIDDTIENVIKYLNKLGFKKDK